MPTLSMGGHCFFPRRGMEDISSCPCVSVTDRAVGELSLNFSSQTKDDIPTSGPASHLSHLPDTAVAQIPGRIKLLSFNNILSNCLMSCTKQIVEAPRQDDTKRSEDQPGTWAVCHETTSWAGRLEGGLLFISNRQLSSRIWSWAGAGRGGVSSCQGRNSGQNNNGDVVGGAARCIL